MLTNFGGECEHILQRHSLFKRPLAGALDDRAVGERIAEGDTQFNYTRTRIDGCEDDIARGGEVGVATGHVGDKGGFVVEVEGHEGSIEISHKRPFGIGVDPGTHHGNQRLTFVYTIAYHLCYCDVAGEGLQL